MPLYIVSTPIGNMGDLSPRALIALKEADIIAAEDTRHSRPIIDKTNPQAKILSYHEHNEQKMAATLLDHLNNRKKVVVISDAGTPGIADPAYRIVKLATDNNLDVIPIPGPCALITALSASGLPTDRFTFEGFLPPKSCKRISKFKSLNAEERTIIFYESPHRIIKALEDLKNVYGDINIVIARELTKIYETFYRGTISSIIEKLTTESPKGEFVLLYNLKMNNLKQNHQDE